MPLYKVQLKQGRRTITNQIEAKSVTDVVTFFETLTTMKVSEVLEVVYQKNTQPPIDDFNYYSLYKGIIKNNLRMSKQIVLNNVKLTVSENDIYEACKNHLLIGGSTVDSSYSSLFKR
jgi:hypothetical protein